MQPVPDLLDHPRVAVGIGKAEERPDVAVVDDVDLAGGDAALEQLISSCCRAAAVAPDDVIRKRP